MDDGLSTISLSNGIGCKPIYQKGTPLPFKKKFVFTSAKSYQKQFVFQFCLGENMWADENISIGTYSFAIKSAPKGEIKVELQFEINEVREFFISVCDQSTGRTKSWEKVDLSRFTPPPVRTPMVSEPMTIDFSDVFNELFNLDGKHPPSRLVSQTRKTKGLAIRLVVPAPYREITYGTTKDINFMREDICPECGGLGGKPGSQKEQCSTCSGKGSLQHVKQTSLGSMTSTSTCPTCKGSGKVFSPSNLCQKCKGMGIFSQNHAAKIDIPPGTNPGTTITLPEAGNVGKNGGPRGDVLVTITVQKFMGLFPI
jgi:hypothetical protein